MLDALVSQYLNTRHPEYATTENAARLVAVIWKYSLDAALWPNLDAAFYIAFESVGEVPDWIWEREKVKEGKNV